VPVLPASGYNTPVAPSIEAFPAAPEVKQDIRATPEAFGGLTADATSRFGQSLEKAAGAFENTYKFYRETAAADQSLKTQIEVNKLMYGDPDVPGDRGYIGLEGEHAMREMPVRRKQIEAIISGARANLGDQYAVSHFDNEIQRFRNYILTDMGRKYDQEMTRWRDQTDKGLKTLSGADASRAANSGDMARFKESLANDEALIRKQGADKGLPKADIDAEVVTRRSLLAKEKAEALLATDPLQAREFINLNGDILTTHHPELLARANAAVTKQMADDIVAGKDVSRYSEKLPGPGLVRGGALQSAADHYSTAVQLGASPNEAALLTSAADAESGFSHTKTHDGGIGYGLYGHNGSRLAAMRDKYGPNPTAAQQIEFALNELRSRPEGAKVNSAKTPEELTELQFQFERPKRGPGDQAGRRLNTTRQFMQNPPSGSSTAPTQPAPSAGSEAPTPTTTAPPAPGTLTPPGAPRTAIPAAEITHAGDSLAGHQIRPKLGVGGGGQESGQVDVYNKGDTAVAGWNSQKILDTVLPNIPDEKIVGKVVALSTGVSNANSPAEAKKFLEETIPAQIALLRERKAASIILMGVGTHPKLAGVNDALAKIAEQNAGVGVVFAGPQRKTQTDKIHSSDQKAEAQAIQEALAKVATPTAPGTPPTPTTGAPPAPTPTGTPPTAAPAAPEVNVGSPRLQELMRSAPERDPGQPADAEVPGLVAALERDAQKIPANAPPGVWQAVVQKERRIFNAAYTDQQHALQARKRDDEANDEQLKREYRLRLGTNNPPTVAEVTADKRFRDEKNAETTIGFIGRALRPDPPAHIAKATTADLYRRMDDKETDRLTSMDPVNQAFINGQITEQNLTFLEKRWEAKTGTREKEVHDKTERIWKSMVLRQLRPHAAMGPMMEQFMDIQAQDQGQMTSGEREMGWREKVADAIAERKAEGKSTKDLFDPKPGNSEYIGSPEFMAEFMPEQALPTAAKGGPDVSTLDAVKRTYKLENPVDQERARAAVVQAFESGKYGPRTSPEAIAKARAILEGLGLSVPKPQFAPQGVPAR